MKKNKSENTLSLILKNIKNYIFENVKKSKMTIKQPKAKKSKKSKSHVWRP